MAVVARATGMQLRGPVGNKGPPGQPFINFAFPNVASFGAMGIINGRQQTAGSIYTFDLLAGNVMPALIRPLRDMSLASVYFTNSNASAGTVALALRNYANDAVVYSTGAIAKNSTFVVGPLAVGQYVLQAGQTYYWSAVGGTGGAYSCWLVPQYYSPSGSAAFTSTYPTLQLNPSFGGLLGLTPSTLSGTPAYMGPVTFQNGTTATFGIQTAGYISSVTYSNQGSGTCQFFLQNTSAGQRAYTGPAIASGGTFTTGTQPPSTIPLAAGAKYAWYITGSGSMAQNLSMQICQ